MKDMSMMSVQSSRVFLALGLLFVNQIVFDSVQAAYALALEIPYYARVQRTSEAARSSLALSLSLTQEAIAPAQSRSLSSMGVPLVAAKSFSANELIVAHINLLQEMAKLESQLRVLLNQRHDILLVIGFSQEVMRSGHVTISPQVAPLVPIYWQNEAAIQNIQNCIQQKEECLRLNKVRLRQITDQPVARAIAPKQSFAAQAIPELPHPVVPEMQPHRSVNTEPLGWRSERPTARSSDACQWFNKDTTRSDYSKHWEGFKEKGKWVLSTTAPIMLALGHGLFNNLLAHRAGRLKQVEYFAAPWSEWLTGAVALCGHWLLAKNLDNKLHDSSLSYRYRYSSNSVRALLYLLYVVTAGSLQHIGERVPICGTGWRLPIGGYPSLLNMMISNSLLICGTAGALVVVPAVIIDYFSGGTSF